MKFDEIIEAVSTLIHSFGWWSWSNDNKTLKAKYNSNTGDYSFTMIEDGKTNKEVEHADIERIARCLITWIKSERLINYN